MEHEKLLPYSFNSVKKENKFYKNAHELSRMVSNVREYCVRESIEIPSNVNLEIKGKKVIVEGKRGHLEKDFSHVKNVLIYKDGNKVVVETYFAKKRHAAVVKTIIAHIRNMFIGVTKGYRYRMKVVYAHFPMSIKVEGSYVVIENFLGKKDKRYAKIVGKDTKVIVEKDDVIIEGIDIDAVGQTAANIHLATHLTGSLRLCPHGRDGGPGVLDGIYVYAKETIEE